LLAIALLTLPCMAPAAETGPDFPKALPSSSPTTRDMQIVLRIRRALMTDEVLGPQNVGVIVRDGTATLWGPLTSPDEIRRALKAVGEVRGVRSVQSELYIAKDTRPLPPVFVLPETTTPDRAPPADALASARPQTILIKRDRLPSNLPATDDNPPSLPAPRTALLLAPVPLNARAEEPTTVTAARTEGVSAAIDRLQKADARFGQIDAEWRDGTIILRGKRHDASAAMAFARLLSDVPGVERVVLQYAKQQER
jgi:osmotically-inducible protein OsmY